MWYEGVADDGLTDHLTQVGYASGPDGVHYSKYAGNPVVDLGDVLRVPRRAAVAFDDLVRGRVEQQVDVSVGDHRWQEARLIGHRQRHSWQWWELITRLDEPGPVAIRSRATDLASRTQPEQPEWNRLGYGNNSIQAVTVEVQ